MGSRSREEGKMGLGSNIMVGEWREEGEGWKGGEVDKEGRRREGGKKGGRGKHLWLSCGMTGDRNMCEQF